ncbi:MAG: hypothetical protein ABFC63_09410 [Thermoguttaceae bacterium]
MAVFVESPWPWLLIGLALETALAIVLTQTRRGVLLWAMLGVAAFVGGGLIVERLVVTDREAIENTLDATVSAVRHNDVNRLLACVASSAKPMRNQARWVLDRVEVQSAWIHGVEIKINRLTSPWSASVSLIATGSARDRRGEIPYETYSRRVVVNFDREGDRWLVTGYTIEGLDPSHL